MVAGFRRSLSLRVSNPNPKSPARQPKSRPPDKWYHVRSTSLPSRPHPITPQLDDELDALRAWQSKTNLASSPSFLSAGLDKLAHLLSTLDDLLHLPNSHNSLRRAPASTNRLLDDFLRLADAHCTFRSAVVELKQHHSATQVAIRGRDEAALMSSIQSLRRVEKEVTKLASDIRDVGISSNTSEAELAGTLREVTAVIASASESVFLGVEAASSSSSSSSTRGSWVVGPLRRPCCKKRLGKEEDEEVEQWRRSALESLKGMEERLEEMESRSARVFRSLVNTRVALLNILTPSL